MLKTCLWNSTNTKISLLVTLEVETHEKCGRKRDGSCHHRCMSWAWNFPSAVIKQQCNHIMWLTVFTISLHVILITGCGFSSSNRLIFLKNYRLYDVFLSIHISYKQGHQIMCVPQNLLNIPIIHLVFILNSRTNGFSFNFACSVTAHPMTQMIQIMWLGFV